MLWVLPDPDGKLDAAVLDAHLCGMEHDLASYNLAGYCHFESRVLERPANWKMPIDTFLEPYHFAPLHRDTVAPIFFANLCLFDAFGLNNREAVIRKSIQTLREQPESAWDFVKHTAISYQLFPNINFLRCRPIMWRPGACFRPGTARIIAWSISIAMCRKSPPPTRRANTGKPMWIWRSAPWTWKDIAMQVDMERGYQAGVMKEVLIGRNEPSLAHFQRAIHRAVTGTSV